MSVLSEKVIKEIEKHEGLWIAATRDEVIAVGYDAKEVLKEAKKRTKKEVIVFKVPRKDEETHIL